MQRYNLKKNSATSGWSEYYKDTHTILTCKKENLNACIHQHAKAIIAQSKYYSLIIDKFDQYCKKETARLEKEAADKKKLEGKKAA